MVVSCRISNSSCLLLNWFFRHSWSCRFNFWSFICFSTHHVKGPNFSLFNHFFIFYAELINLVIISTCQISTFILDYFKTPCFPIAMRWINQFLVCSININCLNFTIIVSNKNLSIQNIKRWCKVVLFQCNLSQELIFSLIYREHWEHIIFSCGYKDTLCTS